MKKNGRPVNLLVNLHCTDSIFLLFCFSIGFQITEIYERRGRTEYFQNRLHAITTRLSCNKH